MTTTSRFGILLLLPLILFAALWSGMNHIASDYRHHPALDAWILLAAIVAALLPTVALTAVVRSLSQRGFAILKGGTVHTSQEIALFTLLRGEIVRWVPFELPLEGSFILEGGQHRVTIDLRIERQLSQDSAGRRLAALLPAIETRLNEQAHDAIHQGSRHDREIASAFDGSRLLNDEDIEITKSKLLSALEMAPIDGIDYPLQPSGITILGKPKISPLDTPLPEITADLHHPDSLDDELLLALDQPI
jgi:hypothetical protein